MQEKTRAHVWAQLHPLLSLATHLGSPGPALSPSALRGLSARRQTWAYPADLSTGNTLIMAETSVQHLISQSVHNSRVDLSPPDSRRPPLSATENALEMFTKILPLERILGLLKSNKVEKATPKPDWLTLTTCFSDQDSFFGWFQTFNFKNI